MLLLAATALSLSLQFLLLLTVFIRNKKALRNIAFFLLSFSLLVWALLSYAYEAFPDSAQNIAVVRLTMFFVVLQNTFFVLFTHALRFETLRFTRKTYAYIALSIITGIVALTPVLFIRLEDGPRGYYPLAGPGMLFFLVHAAISVTKGFRNLAATLRQSNASNRQQLQYIFFGSLVLWGLVPLTNFIFSVALKTTFFGQFSPIYGFVFSSLIAYAIVRHRLFDIKRAVVRSVAYLLSLGFIGLIYGSVIFGLSSVLTTDPQFGNAERVLYVFLALISAILFGPTKRFFDRVTNRIFYRDTYDPQQFLDDLNSAVVENIELGILIRHTTGIIQENLKSSFCFVGIKATPTTQGRLIGTGDLALVPQETALMGEYLHRTGKKIISTDELGSEFSELKKVLSGRNIGLVVRLLPGSDMNKEAMYYILLGDKKSGNIYDKQDERILDIIADEMLIAIQNSIRFEEIEQFNVTLQQKVNDATLKLQRTNKKLRDLDETKDEFISMASHQLRTPLTSVKGYMSMVLEGDAGKLTKQQENLLNQAFVSSQRMVYLIADLLNVSRLKTGKFVIDAQPTNLADIVEGELSQLTETAKGKRIEMKYEKPKKFPKLMLDETKVRQVVMNFVDNAIYYTPSDGHVEIGVREDEGNIYFTVQDDGLGVPKEDQKHLFTKFYRAGNAKKARPDGTGLGLFMAKKVVDAQGGSILFESREGKGSLFGFSFDKRKLAPPENSR